LAVKAELSHSEKPQIILVLSIQKGGRIMKHIQDKKGFTLIELMVVVVFIAIVSGILVPMLLRMYDKARKPDIEQVLEIQSEQIPEKRTEEELPLPQGVPPVIESVGMNMALSSTYHRIGMNVYTRYEVHCKGSLLFRRSAQDENPVLLIIPLPEGRTEARDVRLTLTRMSDSATWEPDNLVYHEQRLYWSGMIPDDERFIAEVNFVALGREQFEYRLPPARQLRSIDIVLELTGVGSPKIPNHALQPTEMSDRRLSWTFNNLVTDRTIIIEIPGTLSPLGRVLLLVRLVAVAVLLFGIGLWYLGEQWQPGHLKNFRWGHFLLLALTYSLYFVIFVVISFHEIVNSWLAMGIAAVFSLPLLLLHVTRVINFKFAYSRALPLAIFTLGLVINGVYGAGVRDYVFITAVIFVIAYLTITYEKWEEGRAKYREQQRAKREKRFEAIRTKLVNDVKQIVDDIQVADMEAQRLVEISEQSELDAERYTLTQKRQPVSELLKEYKELSKRLPDLRIASDGFDQEWYDSFEQEVDQLGKDTRRILEVLRKAIDALKDKKSALRSQREEEEVYCIACGSATPPSPYCRECGTPRYRDLICGECGKQVLLPLHVISEEMESLKLYCPHCGEQYESIVLRTPASPQSPHNGKNKKKSKKS